MKSLSYIFTFIFAVFMFASCDLSNDSASGPGTLQVLLTDAPGDYEEVWIDIQEVRVNRSSDAEDEDGGWITLSTQPVMVDLLDLTNGRFEVLGEAELEEGRYNQLRLILGNDNEVVIDGESHSLSTPSAQQSGLKLNINADVESGQNYVLLLDFDASRSIVQAGQSGIFNLKPVIRTVNLGQTGAIGGTVEPEDAQPWVYAIQNADTAEPDTVAGTRASEAGEFLLIGLLEGSYQISIDPEEEGQSRTVISNVQVTPPDTTFIEPVIL